MATRKGRRRAQPRSDGERSETAYQNACDLYEQIAETLSVAVAALLEARDAGRRLSDEELQTLRDHQKAILMVLGFEDQIMKKHGPADSTRQTLDLDAARAEVARRLACLAGEVG